jgi:hypothetical protein
MGLGLSEPREEVVEISKMCVENLKICAAADLGMQGDAASCELNLASCFLLLLSSLALDGRSQNR